MSPRNRYLVTRSGRWVGSRVPASLASFGPLLGAPLLASLGAVLGAALDSGALVALSLLGGVVIFLATVVAMWVALLRGGKGLEAATRAWFSGDLVTPLALCHDPLTWVFRADVRTRALYVLGLCAEASGDFAEADDLFARASAAVPAFAASKWQRHARCLMLSHRAIALVACHRLDQADAVVREASTLFPPTPAKGVFDALADDVAFGAAGVSTALRDLEPSRDPRALLALAAAAVLSARGMGREALDLVERERHALTYGTLPRERALVARIEARARSAAGGGPMRAPGLVVAAPDGWAERVLPA